MTNRWRTLLLATAIGLLLSLGGAATVEAQWNRNAQSNRNAQANRKCSAKIDKERNKLERDILRFGFNSRQAEKQREKVNRLRQECGGFGIFGRNQNNRRMQRRNQDNDDRNGNNNQGNWYWDGQRWRRR